MEKRLFLMHPWFHHFYPNILNSLDHFVIVNYQLFKCILFVYQEQRKRKTWLFVWDKKATTAGFEPARAKPSRFLVCLLNHSDKLSWQLPSFSSFKQVVKTFWKTIRIWNHSLYFYSINQYQNYEFFFCMFVRLHI